MKKNKSRMYIALLSATVPLIAAQAVPLSTNAVWTWMKGSSSVNQPGTYGTLGTPDPANTPGARREAAAWTDTYGVLWIFGGSGYDVLGAGGYLNDLWVFNPFATNWIWMKGSSAVDQYGIYGALGTEDPANTPGARSGAASWTDNSDLLWLFGGYGQPAAGGVGQLNDLWKFNPATANWTWIKGASTINQNGTYGWQGEPSPINTPGARSGAAVWTDNSGMLWLFGGWGIDAFGNLGALNDLWKFDPATTNWTWMKGANTTNQNGTYSMADPDNTPGARAGAALWSDNSGTLWLFGGYGYPAAGGAGQLNDLWAFNPTTTNWYWMKGSSFINHPGTYGEQGVPDSANMPGARQSVVYRRDAYNSLWLFGGYGQPAAAGVGQLNDLWKFDPATANWTWIKGANTINQPGAYGALGVATPGNMPGARAYALSWMDNAGALWLLGGDGYDASGTIGNLNDMWKFDEFAGGILLERNTLAFSATRQGANPAAQTIGMSNVGGKEITYIHDITYGGGSPGWLEVLPSSGAIAANGATRLTNQVNITGLAAGIYYATNQVTAHDASNSPQTVVVTLTVTDVSPPDNLTASDGLYADRVALTWSAVGGATGYQVWRHTADDSSGASPVGAAAATHYSDTSATGGTLYYYWVKAVYGSTTSAFSASDSGWRRSEGSSHYADVDIDGDRKADLVIFDPLTGAWRVKLSASGYTEASAVFGGSNCTLVPGDYDGDGKTDPGIYDEQTGLWIVMLSSLGYSTASATLGGMGYAPVPGDFDGDFKTDLGVYQASSGGWTMKLSTSGYSEAGTTFGDADHLPVQRDYDGDRKADPAIYHFGNGDWQVMLSGSGYGIAMAVGFGGTGYVPVVGDYDADGKADPALYHESTGLWTVMLSGSGYLIAYGTLGGSGYTALPGDYDGDGRTDPAVYNTATGQWLVMLSGNGYGIATATFGGAGYDPVGCRRD